MKWETILKFILCILYVFSKLLFIYFLTLHFKYQNIKIVLKYIFPLLFNLHVKFEEFFSQAINFFVI